MFCRSYYVVYSMHRFIITIYTPTVIMVAIIPNNKPFSQHTIQIAAGNSHRNTFNIFGIMKASALNTTTHKATVMPSTIKNSNASNIIKPPIVIINYKKYVLCSQWLNGKIELIYF